MPFQKGNKLGGRKTITEEIKHVKETIIEEAKKQTIEELATNKLYQQLETLKGNSKKDRQGVKDLALPVYLKSKPDKANIDFKYQPIYGKLSRHDSDKEDISDEEENQSS